MKNTLIQPGSPFKRINGLILQADCQNQILCSMACFVGLVRWLTCFCKHRRQKCMRCHGASASLKTNSQWKWSFQRKEHGHVLLIFFNPDFRQPYLQTCNSPATLASVEGVTKVLILPLRSPVYWLVTPHIDVKAPLWQIRVYKYVWLEIFPMQIANGTLSWCALKGGNVMIQSCPRSHFTLASKTCVSYWHRWIYIEVSRIYRRPLRAPNCWFGSIIIGPERGGGQHIPSPLPAFPFEGLI